MNKIVATEAQEQAALFEWAERMKGKYPELSLLFAIPNGGSRHPAEAKNLKAQGVKPGVPDLCLPVARGGYHALYIELKRRKGGRTSPGQEAWISALKEQGNAATICFGWEMAAHTIVAYLAASHTL